jgi:replicative DNA helicase
MTADVLDVDLAAAPQAPGSLLDDALALHAAGLCVLPAAEDGSKRPAVDWKQYQHERPDESQLRRWFGGTRAGLGIVCGKVSGGVELTEVEGAAVHAGALVDLAELVDESGETELWRRVTVDGYAVMSPSGGLHLLYRLADAEVPGNTKLAATAEHVTLAETRGEGGWVVTAPSAGTVHPTGRAWRVAAGSPATIPTITADERARLHRLVRSLDQRPVPAPPAPASPFAPLSRAGAGDGISPGDDYTARAEWRDVLAGWRLVFTRGAVGYWRRPGKSTGISATTGYGGSDLLYVFSSSTEFEPERSYDRFGAYAVLHHSGDFPAAAAALRAKGYGGQPAEQPVTAEQPAVASPPTPLTKAPTPPAFPVSQLGGWVADMVGAVAEATQTDAGMAGTLALGALAAAAGGRAEVRVRAGWREPVNLYVVAAAAPGTRKSAVFRELMDPLRVAERNLVDKAAAAVREASTQRDVARHAAEAATRKAGTTADKAKRDELLAEAITAQDAADAITVPPLPRLLADDVTPEAMTSLLAEHGGRLAVASAEGGIFGTFAGRYSKAPNIDAALKGHAGDTLRVDRKGRPPEYVENPALTMALTVQPSVLEAIGRVGEFAGRGLLARFLYALPVSTVGRRTVGADPVPVPVRDRYTDNLRALAENLAGSTDPKVLTLSPAAAELHLAAEHDLEPRLGATGDLAGIVEWASKYLGAVARIAGLLHLAEHGAAGHRQPIGEATMRAALAIGDYYLAHALAVFDLMGADRSLDAARAVLGHLHARGTTETTVRDLFTGLPRSRFPKSADVAAALDVLEDYGWVTRLPPPEQTGPGRPASPRYEVRPPDAAQSAQSAIPLRSLGSADSADNAAMNRAGRSPEGGPAATKATAPANCGHPPEQRAANGKCARCIAKKHSRMSTTVTRVCRECRNALDPIHDDDIHPECAEAA